MNKNLTSFLCKVVYFDEESVTDYMQIILGGKLERTVKLLQQEEDRGEAGAAIRTNIGLGGVFRALIGIDVSAGMDASVQTSLNTQEMAKNIIKNTILTDFIEIVNNKENSEKNDSSILSFRGYSISIHKDSLAYLVLISPYLTILKGGPGIVSGEYSISIEKLESAIKTAKGYYEFVGRSDDKTVIFRFNIKSFKNNYKVTDLLRMNLTLYAIKVGKSTINKLNVNSELELDLSTVLRDNPSYSSAVVEDLKNEDYDTELEVYDVLLAGVEAYD